MRRKDLCLLICVVLFAAKGYAQHERATENVIVILIDGLRWQEVFKGAELDILKNPKYNSADSTARFNAYWAEGESERRVKLMPFAWNYIATHGQLYGNRTLGNKVDVANPYWFSYPGRAEFLSGFVDERINSNSYKNNTNMNVLEFIHSQAGFAGKVAAFACWRPVGKCLNKDNSKMVINIPWEDIEGEHPTTTEQLANDIQHLSPKVLGEGERLDFEVFALGKSYLQAHHPKVLYLDFGDTDEYAHNGEYDKYLEDIHNFDKILKNLWETAQADPFYKGKTSFVIVTDHGRGIGDKWTSHNSDIPHSHETWLMVIGPDTPALGEVKNENQIYEKQFAATIGRLLGFDYTVDGQDVSPYIGSVFK